MGMEMGNEMWERKWGRSQMGGERKWGRSQYKAIFAIRAVLS